MDEIVGILAPSRAYNPGRSYLHNHLYWNTDLTEAARYVRDHGYEWRWFGFRIPWTEIAVGFFYKRPR